jgi:hypothetical protein
VGVRYGKDGGEYVSVTSTSKLPRRPEVDFKLRREIDSEAQGMEGSDLGLCPVGGGGVITEVELLVSG